MAKIRKPLQDALRNLSYRTTVDQLKEKGVAKVNVLGFDRISYLIQESVERSLRHRMLALDHREVASATKEEFMRLLKSNQELEASHSEAHRQKEEAEVQVDALRRELLAQQAALQKRLDQAAGDVLGNYGGEDTDIAQQLNTVFASLKVDNPEDIQASKAQVLGLVMDIVRNQRRSTLEAQQAVSDKEVDLLRRRIEKLSSNLQETEHRLQSVAALKHLDQGISSVYRDVQGLNPEDMAYQRKKELMTDLFKANLALQKGA